MMLPFSQSATAIATATLISGLTSIILLPACKIVEWDEYFNAKCIKGNPLAERYKNTYSGQTKTIIVLCALAGMFATDLFNEFLDLPDNLEDVFYQIAKQPIGILTLGFVGPVAEECVFRTGIINNLIRRNIHPLIAVIVSALIFGVIHGNPIQIPFAFVGGLILGYVYIHTGNILMTSIIHIINNSSAIIEMNIWGEEMKELHIYDFIGKPLSLTICIILAAICIIGLKYSLGKKK